MWIITREFQWDAAHRVLNHESKCRYLHGHRYRAEVTVKAPELDPLGRVIDFGSLKEIVGTWIDTNWDHGCILHPEDPLIDKIDLLGKPAYKMPDGKNPTAENIAKELFSAVESLMLMFGKSIQPVGIRVWETPSCSASYPS